MSKLRKRGVEMENQELNLGELTLEEFAAIFSDDNSKLEITQKRDALKNIDIDKIRINNRGIKGKITAILQSLLVVYCYSDSPNEIMSNGDKQRSFEMLKKIWKTLDSSNSSSDANSYFGGTGIGGKRFVEDIIKKMGSESAYNDIKECTVNEISILLREYSDERQRNSDERQRNSLKDKKCDDVYRMLGINITTNQKENSVKESKDNADELENLISNGATQIILTGAPGTGKTRMAKEIAKQGAELTWEEKKEKDDSCPHYKLVQFHPSYDYTDFVEGLRPVEEEGKMVFRKVDGIFKEFCRKVVDKGEKDKKYFFLIDEINRADLSKVFGELMFCLETDKRGEDNAIQTQYQNLPTYDTKEKKYYGEDESEDVFKDGFYIPENVIIIGTMNDIDRSVESMDFALRRRFIWKEVEVDEKLLQNSLTAMLTEYTDKNNEKLFTDDNARDVAKGITFHIMNLNKVLRGDSRFGKHYFISQGQFANLPENIIETAVNAGKKVKEKGEEAEEAEVEAIAKSLLEAVWNLRLNSLLYEYIRGEGNEENFVKSCHETLLVPSRSQEQPEENSES